MNKGQVLEHRRDEILAVLDECADDFTFPMLDNGYVYLAATRLSLFRSEQDWTMTIEVFGYFPRAVLPGTHIYTFGSKIRRQRSQTPYATEQEFRHYLRIHPNDDHAFVSPIEEGSWQDPECSEFVSRSAGSLILRGRKYRLPLFESYSDAGIEFSEPPRILVFELCRVLAHQARDAVLATGNERRTNVPPELRRLLTLDEWHHPDVVKVTERPSGSETFQQLAEVLVSGDTSAYQPTEVPNTHWSNWPDGGSL